MNPSDLKTLGSERGLEVRITSPFDRTGTPEELDVNTMFTRAAFALRDDEPYGGPIEGTDHVYVITTEKRIPSTNANFDDVKDRVEADYRLQQATLKAREAGRAFAAQLTNSLATGKTFTEAATAAGVRAVLLPQFSRRTQSLPEVEEHTSLGMFKQVAFDTPVRSASDFNFTVQGGYVVYVAEELSTDEAALQAELPEYSEAVRGQLQSEAFNAWFAREAETGLRDTPLHRQAPPEVSAAPN